ncbi:unnamed protein product, partial [Ixodes pacificus]
CFPLKETWYVTYRSHEIDPGFGGKAKCVKGSQTGPMVAGTAPILLHIGGTNICYYRVYFVSKSTKTNFTPIDYACFVLFFFLFANQSVWDVIIRVRYNSTVHSYEVL